MAICISPRALISKAPAVSVSFTCKRNVAARFADQPLAHVARGDELPFAPGEGRVVDQNPHPDGGRIDVDKLQRRALLAIGQCFADENFLETGQADDVAGAGML